MVREVTGTERMIMIVGFACITHHTLSCLDDSSDISILTITRKVKDRQENLSILT